MSGKVYADRILRRYWELVPEETRDAIEAAIPDGHWIRIFAGHRAQPGTGTVSLRTDDNRSIADSRGRDLARMCFQLIRYAKGVGAIREQAGLGAVRITTDAEGYVTDIEDIG